MKVADVGEQGLLKILQAFCPPDIIGDDAAVLKTNANQSLVVTTDVLVDNIHFSDITTSATDVGWRAAAANLSDLAAMGASPLGITIGLGLPANLPVNWVENLYRGMTECLQRYNTPIVGGDIVRSPVITIAITAFGEVEPLHTIRRDTAKVGDAIVVTGVHGASRAGLELLLHPQLGDNLNTTDKQALICAHQRPQPRLDVLPILWEILESYSLLPRSSHSPFPISGMDSSDGLADAVVQICRASGVGAILHRQQIPLPNGLQNWLEAGQIIEYALYGGEDFQLVLCLPTEPAYELVRRLDQPAAVVGKIIEGSQVILRDHNQELPDQVLNLSQGFQHFTS
ncbi:MAG: thiamine-phosphate kinase [Nostocaceae cyanobacterium]|nr:thiamine-phosphate kinase [Nostocaceae cyanobacterium]